MIKLAGKKTLLGKVSLILRVIIKYASLMLAAFLALVPVVVCLFTAFKDDKEYAATKAVQLPSSWLNFDNFKTAWEKANMGTGFINSTIILIGVLAGAILFGTMMAYILSRFRFKGNNIIRNLFLFASLIPGIAMQVTVYKIMDELKLIDTMHGYMLLLMGTDVISIYIFIQFF
jgi:multiple sugar transport system permease protein